MLFRTPLLKYLNFCCDRGSLSHSFLTASIKLIPKKGDSSQINNWRPISLLNCIYKILSKAVNNRLKKIADNITSRAQKGFTQSRYIQEVLINVIHSIKHCNEGNIPAFVLYLDQRKAFDSVRHDFMLEVYKFWGLGKISQKCLILTLQVGMPPLYLMTAPYPDNSNWKTERLREIPPLLYSIISVNKSQS